MGTFIIHEVGTTGEDTLTVLQSELKTWLTSCYLTYNDFLEWFYNEDMTWLGYLTVISLLYNDLYNKLNDFTYSDCITWDGFDLFDAEFMKPVEIRIGKKINII